MGRWKEGVGMEIKPHGHRQLNQHVVATGLVGCPPWFLCVILFAIVCSAILCFAQRSQRKKLGYQIKSNVS